MIVFDLACVHGHWFEAWFNSSELIHGAVSPAEAADLHADGVAALPLLVPFVPPEQAN